MGWCVQGEESVLAGMHNECGGVTPIPSIIQTTTLPHLAQLIGELVEE